MFSLLLNNAVITFEQIMVFHLLLLAYTHWVYSPEGITRDITYALPGDELFPGSCYTVARRLSLGTLGGWVQHQQCTCFPTSQQHWVLLFLVIFADSLVPICTFKEILLRSFILTILSGSSSTVQYVAETISLCQPPPPPYPLACPDTGGRGTATNPASGKWGPCKLQLKESSFHFYVTK